MVTTMYRRSHCCRHIIGKHSDSVSKVFVLFLIENVSIDHMREWEDGIWFERQSSGIDRIHHQVNGFITHARYLTSNVRWVVVVVVVVVAMTENDFRHVDTNI